MIRLAGCLLLLLHYPRSPSIASTVFQASPFLAQFFNIESRSLQCTHRKDEVQNSCSAYFAIVFFFITYKSRKNKLTIDRTNKQKFQYLGALQWVSRWWRSRHSLSEDKVTRKKVKARNEEQIRGQNERGRRFVETRYLPSKSKFFFVEQSSLTSSALNNCLDVSGAFLKRIERIF